MPTLHFITAYMHNDKQQASAMCVQAFNLSSR